MNAAEIAKRPWLIVLGCCIGLAVSTGALMLLIAPVLMAPITNELGWSRTQYSAGFSIITVGVLFGSPIAGYFIDRIGSRRVIIFGCIALPIVGVSLIVAANSYVTFLMWCVAMGAILGAGTPTPFIALLPQWIGRHLGISIGLALASTMLSAALAMGVVQWISSTFDWRYAWGAMAILMLGIGLPNALILLHDNPNRRSSTPQAGAVPDKSYGVAIRSREFWLLVVGLVLMVVAAAGIQFHAPALIMDQGVSPQIAASAAALVPIGSIIGRLGSGLLLDQRVPYWGVAIVVFVLLEVACWILLYHPTGIAPFIAFAFVGLTLGAEADLLPFAIREKFGTQAFGKLYGLGFGLFQFGPMCGPTLMSLVFDYTGSYAICFVAFALTIPLAISLVVLSRHPSRATRRIPEHVREGAN